MYDITVTTRFWVNLGVVVKSTMKYIEWMYGVKCLYLLHYFPIVQKVVIDLLTPYKIHSLY